MDPITGAMIGGAVISGAASIFGGNQQNNANAEQAREQMAFQERMRGTQYQTAVEDMKAAGLNPALAYSKGGAGTPAGAQAHMENTMAGVAGTAQSAAATYAAMTQAKNVEAQTRQLNLESIARLENLTTQTMATNMNAKTASDLATQEIQNKRQTFSQSAATFEDRLKVLKRQLQFLDLDIPAAQNRSKAATTWFGRNVQPYLHDAKSATGILRDLDR